MYTPDSAVWEITLRCNFSCSHCGSSAGGARLKELNTKEAFALVRDLADISCKNVCLMGGEPFLRSDWEELAREVVNYGMALSFVSNGWMLEEHLPTLRKLEPMVVGISLDGTKEVHDTIRTTGSFKRAVRALLRLRENNIEATAITTVSKQNFDCLPFLRRLLAGREIGWQIQVAVPMGRFGRAHLLSPEEFYALGLFLVDSRKRYGLRELPVTGGHCMGYYSYNMPSSRLWNGCVAGKKTLGISSDGGIRGCLAIPSAHTAGNIRATPFRSIWEEDTHFSFTRLFNRAMLGENCQSCSYGAICKGGCSSMSCGLTGSFNNNPYCFYRIERALNPGRKISWLLMDKLTRLSWSILNKKRGK
ncbi:MAG: radical SAM protein [Candidatus Hodarchaeales archaeon]|jgi:radical SAM protein with 4Fe4S-binding SPASM domain